MDKFQQEFLIKSRKPLMDGDNLLYNLSVVVTTSIDTRKPLELDEDLWGLFIDKEYEPNDMKPLLLVPIPDSQLMLLNEEEKRNIKYSMEFYKDIYHSDMKPQGLQEELPYVSTVEIDKEEFYKIINNDLHFIHEANLPCQSYKVSPR
ncbi:hypothetical protein QI305_12250 [Staphylococcus saprophyticus]|nr:hypothetical protein [Staphylococcus saprophyticus]